MLMDGVGGGQEVGSSSPASVHSSPGGDIDGQCSGNDEGSETSLCQRLPRYPLTAPLSMTQCLAPRRGHCHPSSPPPQPRACVLEQTQRIWGNNGGPTPPPLSLLFSPATPSPHTETPLFSVGRVRLTVASNASQY